MNISFKTTVLAQTLAVIFFFWIPYFSSAAITDFTVTPTIGDNLHGRSTLNVDNLESETAAVSRIQISWDDTDVSSAVVLYFEDSTCSDSINDTGIALYSPTEGLFTIGFSRQILNENPESVNSFQVYLMDEFEADIADYCINSTESISIKGFDYFPIEFVYTEFSTTSEIIIYNNPTLDWFLGFTMFLICMIFPIWLFKRK